MPRVLGEVRDTISSDAESVDMNRSWSAGVCLHNVETSSEMFVPSSLEYVDTYDDFQGSAISRSLLISSAIEISSLLTSSAATKPTNDTDESASPVAPPQISTGDKAASVAPSVSDGLSPSPSVASAALACMQFVNNNVGTAGGMASASKPSLEHVSTKPSALTQMLLVSTVPIHALPALSTTVVCIGNGDLSGCLYFNDCSVISAIALKNLVMRRIETLSRSNGTCNCIGKVAFDVESVKSDVVLGRPVPRTMSPYIYSCLALSSQVLYIEEDRVIAKRMVNETVFAGVKSASGCTAATSLGGELMNAESVVGVGKILLKDPRWMLIAGIQASLVGQFRAYLENVASLPQNNVGVAANATATAGPFTQVPQLPSAWEESLRLFFKWSGSDLSNPDLPADEAGTWIILDRLFKYDSIGVKKHISSVAPFIIRLQPSNPVSEACNITNWELNIFTALELLQQEQDLEMLEACKTAEREHEYATEQSKENTISSTRNIPSPAYGSSCSLVSEWYLLELFIVESLKQVNMLSLMCMY